MKSFEGFKSEPMSDRMPQLPVGAYICAIQSVKEEGDYPDDSLVLRLEVVEGEWAGYYSKRFKRDSEMSVSSRSSYPVRYKGDFRIRAPRAENPHIGNLEWAIRNFNNAIWAIEDSNDGYHFDFANVAALRGKYVGINVREAQFQGNIFTEIGRLESVKMVREGKVKPMKVREERPSAYSAPAAASPSAPAGFFPVEVDEIPF